MRHGRRCTFLSVSGVAETRGEIWTAAHQTRDGGSSVVSPSLFYWSDGHWTEPTLVAQLSGLEDTQYSMLDRLPQLSRVGCWQPSGSAVVLGRWDV
jgi:hypothetical protein